MVTQPDLADRCIFINCDAVSDTQRRTERQLWQEFEAARPQILGVLLVSGSLVFVGLQMRQTHAIERANAQRDLLDQTRSWWLLGVENEAIFDTISAGLQDFKGLSRFQQGQFNAWGMSLHHICEVGMIRPDLF